MKDSDFETELADFREGLKRTFPLIRMYMDDAHDACVSVFIFEEYTTLDDFKDIAKALNDVQSALHLMLTGMAVEGTKFTKQEEFIQSVGHLELVVAHLNAVACSICKIIEFGGNPKNI